MLRYGSEAEPSNLKKKVAHARLLLTTIHACQKVEAYTIALPSLCTVCSVVVVIMCHITQNLADWVIASRYAKCTAVTSVRPWTE